MLRRDLRQLLRTGGRVNLTSLVVVGSNYGPNIDVHHILQLNRHEHSRVSVAYHMQSVRGLIHAQVYADAR